MEPVFEQITVQVGDTELTFITNVREFTAADIVLHGNTMNTHESAGKMVCTCRSSLSKTGNNDFDMNYAGNRTVYTTAPLSLRGKRINSDSREEYIEQQRQVVTDAMQSIINGNTSADSLHAVVAYYNERLSRYISAVNHKNSQILRSAINDSSLGAELIQPVQTEQIQRYHQQITENNEAIRRLNRQRLDLMREIQSIKHTATTQSLSGIDHPFVLEMINRYEQEYQLNMVDNTMAAIILGNEVRSNIVPE